MKMDLQEYYLELSVFLFSILGGLMLKDYSVSLIKGLKFKLNSQFQEGQKVLLEGEQAMIVKIGWQVTTFGVYSPRGYTWRYVSNTKIEGLKLEKIVDADLHVDSAHEKAMKLRNILEEKDND
tara:strand:- start:186 stop:554 length:369 start_codon:yes stop_codon:yes gene_type:complete